MLIQVTKEELEELGYAYVRQLPDGRWVGVQKFMFTTGLMVGLDSVGYSYRYCFHEWDDARDALAAWDGNEEPSGNWIKRKGRGGDYNNPNYRKEND